MDSSKHNLPRNDGGSSRIRSWSVVVGLAVAAMSIVSSLLAPPARAQTPTITGFPAFLAGLWPAAEARGITRATFDEAFKGLEPDLTLPELVLPGKDGGERKSQQAEFVRSPAEYLNPKTLANLTATGRDLAHKWSADLARIEQQYGVPRSIVLAIWGRETAFGTYKPPHDAIRAIATQAYLGRRRDKFRDELIFALKMLQEGHVTRSEFKASWAGAFGLTQFLPSDFYKYAVDFDGDGRRDLLHSVPDALASAAAQLAGYGWEKDKGWGWEMQAPNGVDCSLEGLAHVRPMRDWLAAGLVQVDGRAFGAGQQETPLMLLAPAGTYGPMFLTTRNFQVIKAYNFADLYALFVGHLANRIAGGREQQIVGPWGAVTPMAERDAQEIQGHLRADGFEIEKLDGKVGTKTRSALGLYQKRHGLKLDCWPTPATLAFMRKTAAGRTGAPAAPTPASAPLGGRP